jgi:hypothetical protein
VANKPNPICIVCGKSILPGVPRYRRGLASRHADCGKDKKKPQAVTPKTAALDSADPASDEDGPQGGALA